MGPSEEQPCRVQPPTHRGWRCSSGCPGKLLVLVGQFLPCGAVFSWSCSPRVRTSLQGTQTSPFPGHHCGWHKISPALPRCASLLSGRDSPEVYLQEKVLAHKEQEVQAWG